jgi:18S rRNA (guanine1575-N7)-methyltransferase
MISQAAVRSGFLADLIIDFPNSTRAKKFYLVLYNGPVSTFKKVGALATEEEEGDAKVKVFKNKDRKRHMRVGGKPGIKSKEWIMNKKKRAKFTGKEVKHDSKYTGRKRRPKF